MAIERHGGVRGVTVGGLLAEPLMIPPYQRPYSWEPATAEQLLDDVRDAFSGNGSPSSGGEVRYVLGAVILHRDVESGQVDVVDGQQRLLTLSMLLDLLDGDEPMPTATNPESPIVRVQAALARRVRALPRGMPAGLASFIRDSCELIRVETNDPDEAFRVFDSQNYRGKSLLPHDLLKAYHLREMRGESDAMRAALVEGWESVPDADLDRLFATFLWRIRCWSRGLRAPAFSTDHVDVFKGVATGSARTPSARYHFAAQAAVPLLSALDLDDDAGARTAKRSRFQLEAPVFAGRAFFEMVTFMLTELKRLRKDVAYTVEGWADFSSTNEALHDVPSRSRYRYVAETYLAALLYYTNKFGEEHVDEARQRLFAWAYSPRTRLKRVQMLSVNNHASGRESRTSDGVDVNRSAFMLIRNADSARELRRLTADVKGYDGDPDHEKQLLTLLGGLGG